MPDAYPYRALYDRLRQHGYHEVEDQSTHLEPYVPWLKSRLKYNSVLDIGCSAGGSLPLLASEGQDAWGVDVSMEAVAVGVSKGRNVVCASATGLPFPDNQFDLVVSADVFEHLHPDDASQAAREAIRVAKRFIFMKIAEHEDATVKWKELAGHPLHLTTQPIDWWTRHFEHAGTFIRLERYILCMELDTADGKR